MPCRVTCWDCSEAGVVQTPVSFGADKFLVFLGVGPRGISGLILCLCIGDSIKKSLHNINTDDPTNIHQRSPTIIIACLSIGASSKKSLHNISTAEHARPHQRSPTFSIACLSVGASSKKSLHNISTAARTRQHQRSYTIIIACLNVGASSDSLANLLRRPCRCKVEDVLR